MSVSSHAQGASIPLEAFPACPTATQGDARLERVVRCSQRLQVRQVGKPRRECAVEAVPCTRQPSRRLRPMQISAAGRQTGKSLRFSMQFMQVCSTKSVCNALTRKIQAQEVAVSVADIRVHLHACVSIIKL